MLQIGVLETMPHFYRIHPAQHLLLMARGGLISQLLEGREALQAHLNTFHYQQLHFNLQSLLN